MIDNFPNKLEGVGKFPWTGKLFSVNTKSKKLEYDKEDIPYFDYERNVPL